MSVRKLNALEQKIHQAAISGSGNVRPTTSRPSSLPGNLTFLRAEDHPEGSRLGIFGAMPGFGGLFVLLFAPYVADGLGRKKGTAVGCVIVIVGALMQCFPQNGHGPRRDALYLVGRFIMGCGSNISNATCPLLITEIAHPRHRGKITDRKSTRLNSSHSGESRMPSSA